MCVKLSIDVDYDDGVKYDEEKKWTNVQNEILVIFCS